MSYTLLYVHRFSGVCRFFAFIGVALMRIPLWFKSCVFWKIMGCGKNASVHLPPDFKHWAVLTVWNQMEEVHRFKRSLVVKYFEYFSKETAIFVLQSTHSHGTWDKKQPFDTATNKTEKIAILTRATIYLKQRKRFQSFTSAAHQAMIGSAGFYCAVGMGENPWNKQATFSVWDSESQMLNFAYKNEVHTEIIKLTRKEKWYKEDLFARFNVLEMSGILNGMQI